MNTLLSKSAKLLLIVIVFLSSFIGNVLLHETGHYLTASMFGLNPSMYVSSPAESLNYIFESKPIASVSFSESASNEQTFLVGLMGPAVNLFLAVIFLVIYIESKQNKYIGKSALAAFLPSILSFIINILPLGSTDGSVLLSLL